MMSHELAQQLLRLPDGFIYATHGDNEFTISSFQDVWDDCDLRTDRDDCFYDLRNYVRRAAGIPHGG